MADDNSSPKPGDVFRRLYIASLHNLNPDQAQRLCALLVLHLDLDRALSWRLHMADLGDEPGAIPVPNAEEFDRLSWRSFNERLTTVAKRGLISAQTAREIDALNKTLNRLLHVGSGRDFYTDPTITDEATFWEVYSGGQHGLEELFEPERLILYGARDN